jgi:hypothetical protein
MFTLAGKNTHSAMPAAVRVPPIPTATNLGSAFRRVKNIQSDRVRRVCPITRIP